MRLSTCVCNLFFFLLVGTSLAAPVVFPDPVVAQPSAQSAPSLAAPEFRPAPPAPISATEVVENPYGFESLWKQGDFVAKGTLLTLMIMSIGTWYIAIVKLLEQAKLFKQAKNADDEFWKADSVQDGILRLPEDSTFRFVAEKGFKAAEHHGGALRQQVDLNYWVGLSVQRALDTVGNRLQNGLAFLATVGSTAPFVGLFGTVWGIYHALIAIGIAGQASIDKVAGPVGEALIMTALGLAVAVPAVLGYNWLVRRNKVAMELVRHFGGGVHMTLIGRGLSKHSGS